MAPYSFPVVTLVLGAAGGYLADALRDSRAAAREAVAIDRARQRERDAFQRETLIELQDWLAKLGRATGAIHHHDQMEHHRTQMWARTPVGEEWNLGYREAQVNVNRLRVRVLDDDVRRVVREFSSASVDLILRKVAGLTNDEARTRATHAFDRATSLNEPMQELIGDRLSELA